MVTMFRLNEQYRYNIDDLEDDNCDIVIDAIYARPIVPA
ncbi:hypothetical protein BAL199_19493 [alpha proteobacterium BAL199]|nr:hypothetical protein BAL199_19493 [alpha proteobacterium BAL199]